MSKLASTLAGALVLVALVGCSESQLVVPNRNNPDETRALAAAADVENLVGSQFRNIHNYTDGDILEINSQLLCLGLENASGLANADMAKTTNLPRVGVDNTRGNTSLSEKFTPYSQLYSAARSVALGLHAMNQTAFTFLPASAAEIARDKAFGYFELGVAMGDIALVYDSGAVVSPNDDVSGAAPNLVGAATLMATALADLDTAQINAALTPTGGNGFPLPSTWINGQALTAAQFIQLIRAWKARLRAGVARTPADRAAVNWAQVIADAQAGITADFTLSMTQASPNWAYRPVQMDLYGGWHMMWQFILGMADTSGAYSAFLANPAGVTGGVFVVATPDLRFPAGATRAAQNTASGCTSSGCLQPVLPYPYLRNRLAGADQILQPLWSSEYDFYRFQWFFNANRVGKIPTVTLAEMNALIAEGKLRGGAAHDAAGAIAAINVSRVAAGLPAIPAGSDSGTVVPGTATSCVPKVPASPAFTSATCGTVWEAMKWEKRMETAYTHWGAWWIDGRGWGDLPVGTIEEYPTPYQELDTRQETIYSTSKTTAAKGTYGI